MIDEASDLVVKALTRRRGMATVKMMDGEWRGTASQATPGGKEVTFTQTERAGSLLDGSIKVVEGRGNGAGVAVGPRQHP